MNRNTDDVEKELVELKATKEKQSHGLTMMEAVKNLSRSYVRTPFFLVLTNFFLVPCSGVIAFTFYAVEIFDNAGININKYLAAVIVASVRIVGGFCSIFLVQKLPRVKLGMTTMSIMSLSTFILGLVFYLKENQVENELLDILPVVCLSIYTFCFGAGNLRIFFYHIRLYFVSGAGPLQWVFVGELLPPEYKVLSGVITFFLQCNVFTVSVVFPRMLEALMPYGTYWLFSAIALSSNVFYYFFVPETRGKSLLEIQQRFLKHQS